MRISAIQGSGYYHSNNIKSINSMPKGTQIQPSFQSKKGAAWGAATGALWGIGVVALTGGIGALGLLAAAFTAGVYTGVGAYLGDSITGDNTDTTDTKDNKPE